MKHIYKIGIELEGYIHKDNFQPFHDQVAKFPYRIDNDASIRVSSYSQRGVEIKPLHGLSATQIYRSIPSICQYMKKYDVKVNETCGFHLHLSHKKLHSPYTLRRLLKLWLAIEDILVATQPISRHKNRFCHRLLKGYANGDTLKVPNDYSARKSYVGLRDRYQTINLHALYGHGTIETRLHAGTTDAKTILNWIRLITSIYDYALSPFYDPKKIQTLFEMPISDKKIKAAYDLLALPEKLQLYFTTRIDKQKFRTLSYESKAAITVRKIDKIRKQLQAQKAKLDLKLKKIESENYREISIINNL